MLTERTLWLSATTMAIGILVLMMLQPRPERRDLTRRHPNLDVIVSIDGGHTWMIGSVARAADIDQWLVKIGK